MPEDPRDVSTTPGYRDAEPQHLTALSAEEEAEMEALLQANARPGACPAPALLFAAMEDVLPPDEQAAIRAHADHCVLCRSLLEAAESEEAALTPAANDRIRATIEAKLEAAAQPRVVAMPARRSSSWRVPLGIAAAIVLACIIGLAWRARRAEVPASQTAVETVPAPMETEDVAELHTVAPLAPPTDVPQMVTRGDTAAGEPSTADLLPAFRAYNRAEYASSAAEFTKLRARFPHSDIVLTYLGVSQLEAGDSGAAEESLLAAKAVAKPVRQDAIAWYLAIAELRARDRTSALPLFAGLCKGQSIYRTRSCKFAAALR